MPPICAGSQLGGVPAIRHEKKIIALRQLAKKRRESCWPGFHSIGDYHGGRYDGEEVSPYTRGSGNPDSPVVLVLQDWCGENYLLQEFNPELARIGRDNRLQTNRRLAQLVKTAFGLKPCEVYTTNLFPFIKPGDMSTKVPAKIFRRAAREFTIPEIKVVRPRLVVCLGADVYRALVSALSGEPMRATLANLIATPRDYQLPQSAESTRFWAQAHPGGLGTAHRGKAQMNSDWEQMANWFRQP